MGYACDLVAWWLEVSRSRSISEDYAVWEWYYSLYPLRFRGLPSDLEGWRIREALEGVIVAVPRRSARELQATVAAADGRILARHAPHCEGQGRWWMDTSIWYL